MVRTTEREKERERGREREREIEFNDLDIEQIKLIDKNETNRLDSMDETEQVGKWNK